MFLSANWQTRDPYFSMNEKVKLLIIILFGFIVGTSILVFAVAHQWLNDARLDLIKNDALYGLRKSDTENKSNLLEQGAIIHSNNLEKFYLFTNENENFVHWYQKKLEKK